MLQILSPQVPSFRYPFQSLINTLYQTTIISQHLSHPYTPYIPTTFQPKVLHHHTSVCVKGHTYQFRVSGFLHSSTLARRDRPLTQPKILRGRRGLGVRRGEKKGKKYRKKLNDADPQFTQLICVVPHTCSIKGPASLPENPFLENTGSSGTILVACNNCRLSKIG